jgi:hypothetical protein
LKPKTKEEEGGGGRCLLPYVSHRVGFGLYWKNMGRAISAFLDHPRHFLIAQSSSKLFPNNLSTAGIADNDNSLAREYCVYSNAICAPISKKRRTNDSSSARMIKTLYI